MVHFKPKISLGFPSTMSAAPIVSNRTLVCKKKKQALVDVFDLVHSHFSADGFAELFSGNYFQQSHETFSVSQIDEQVVDLDPTLA